MFRRIIHEHWHDLVPVIAFILTFAVFVAAFVRALLARKETVARMAALPLDVQVQPMEPGSPQAEKVEASRRAGCSDTCRRCPSCRDRSRPDPHPDHSHDHEHDDGHSHPSHP